MKKKKLSGKALVIQLDKYQMRVARMGLSDVNAPPLASAIVPVPEGAVDDGAILNMEAMIDLLKTTLAASEFRGTRRAVFCLSTSQIIGEQITVPIVSESRLQKLLESNMDVYFPVNTADYRLVWQVIGPAENGAEQNVQLWAVPRAMVESYYTLANACGLKIEAVDYCGHSIATAVGASFAEQKAGKKHRARKFDGDADAPETGVDICNLYLSAEQEHLMMTAERGGRVLLQRTLQRGYDWASDMGEVMMALEYYNSMSPKRLENVVTYLTGSFSQSVELYEAARQELGYQVRVYPDSEWSLCRGAGATDIDFGEETLNKKAGFSGITQGWQYGLILASGIILVAVSLFTLGNRLRWNATVDGLNAGNSILRIQLEQLQNDPEAQRCAEYGEKYQDYETIYNSYSDDWDNIFNDIGTYNDNLSLILQELEQILPSTSTVAEIGVAEPGMAVHMFCQDKEQAAAAIIAMRNMKYAHLAQIYDLGWRYNPYYPKHPAYPHTTVLAALPGLSDWLMKQYQNGLIQDEVSQAFLDYLAGLAAAQNGEAANTETDTDAKEPTTAITDEKPPTEGSALSDLINDYQNGDLDVGKIVDRVLGSEYDIDTLQDKLDETDRLERVVAVAIVKSEMESRGIDPSPYDDIFEAIKNGDVKSVESQISDSLHDLYNKLNGGGDNPPDNPDNPPDNPDNPPVKPDRPGTTFSDDISKDNQSGMEEGQLAGESILVQLEPEYITNESVTEAMQGLSAFEWAYLQGLYGKTAESVLRYSNIVKTWKETQTALRTMLNNSRPAYYRTLQLYREDLKDSIGANSLFSTYRTKLAPYRQSLYQALASDQMSEALRPYMVDMMTGEKPLVDAVEAMILQDEKLTQELTYYLLLQKGRVSAQEGLGALDINQLVNDLKAVSSEGLVLSDGNYSFEVTEDTDVDSRQFYARLFANYLDRQVSGPDRAKAHILALIYNKVHHPVVEPGSNGVLTDEDLLALFNEWLKSQTGNTGSGNTDIGSLIDRILNGDLFNNGSGSTQAPAKPEYRVELTVLLGYKNELRDAEQQRHGLDRGAKIAKLEPEVADR